MILKLILSNFTNKKKLLYIQLEPLLELFQTIQIHQNYLNMILKRIEQVENL